MPDHRRTFLRSVLAAAAVPVSRASAKQRTSASDGSVRAQVAQQIRDDAAHFQCAQAAAPATTNGDETSLPAYIGNFTKGLPHTQLGEVEPGSYESLLHALSTGQQADFEALERGSGSRFVNPLAAYAFQMEGADSHRLGTAAPPSLGSAEAAGEMVELYWQALSRDVAFADYATSPITLAAIQDLNRLSAFHGSGSNGAVTPANLFRGSVRGGLDGPYLSQFLCQPIPVNSTIVAQQYRCGAAGVDYLTSWSEWLALQTGVPPFRAWAPNPQGQYINNGRSLAEWVHYDTLYQAFHNAALILVNQSPDTVLSANPYLNATNPYKTTKVEGGFVTFGIAHICCMLGTVCQAALLAAWYQKWMVHRRARPEAFGGVVHQTKLGSKPYPIHSDLLNSAALQAVFDRNSSYLLPQAFPEGAPLHPSYPSGHATVAGACSVVLKAFFDEDAVLTNCVVSGNDGVLLNPYQDLTLTVGGEVNKLAFNVAMGRNFAGIHYRSDAEAGIRLGEEVAIAMLQDYVNTFAEDFTGFRFRRVDGTEVAVNPNAA